MIEQETQSWPGGHNKITGATWPGGHRTRRFVDTGDRMEVAFFTDGDLAGRAFVTCESEAFDDELTPELARDIIQLLTEWLAEYHGEETR